MNINSKRIYRIYISYPRSHVFYNYPCEYNNNDIITFSTGNAWCVDNEGHISTSYNFKCRPWYSDASSLFNYTNKKQNVTISYLYTFTEGDIGITLCIRFLHPFEDEENSDEKENFIIVCIDLIFESMKNKLDQLSDRINGYFFIARIKSGIPLFYSGNYYVESNDYSNEEFGLADNYFLDEINEYINETYANFTSYIDYSKNKTYPKIEGKFIRNNTEWSYRVFPVLFNDKDEYIHLINLIYIEKSDLMDNYISSSVSAFSSIIWLFLVLFVFNMIILSLLSKYFLKSIAHNIVLPIKNIKKIIKKMNEEEQNMLKEEEKVTKEEERNSTSNNSMILDDTSTIKEEDNQDSEESSNEEIDSDEEEFINIRSKDIQTLFCRLIEVRDCLNKVSTFEESGRNKEKDVGNMLFAISTFTKVNNRKAEEISNSN